MADNRTMAQLLQAPTEGYEDAIVIPEINANFELKHGLINLVQNKQFFRHDKEDPHAHIHSLNSCSGGKFLDKMPRECLRIIESKSKVRNSRNKAVIAKVSSNSSTPGISPDVVALTTEVSKLKSLIKTMLIDKQQAQAPATVKVARADCVTYGGAHSLKRGMGPAMRWQIGLKDALIEMPKFNKWLSTLLRNKEKLEEIAITTVNAECSAIILNKVPEKLEDPGKFLIPCALQELDRTNALADSGASINLLPHSIYKQLGLGALKPTRMTLELANRSVTHPMGIAEDVVVRVDGFTFLADFVMVNFEPDPRVPIILGRPFLRTAKALIDLYEEKLTLRVGSDELVFYAEKSEKSKNKQFAHAISVIDFSKDEPFSGSTTNHSDALPPSSSPVKTSDNLEEFADELTLLKKDVHFQVYSNPLFEFDDNFTSSNVNHLFNKMDEDVNVSDEPVLLNSPLTDKVECPNPEDDIDEIDAFLAMEVSSNYEEGYFDSEGDVIFLENLLSDDTTHNLAPEFAGELITLPSRIVREYEDYLNHMTLLCEISTSRSQENVHANQNDLIPLGVENDDSEGKDNELPNLDHQDDPSIPCPPPEPPDVEKCLESEAGTDKTKITRKPSKTGKHGHENGRVQKKSKNQAKVKKSKLSNSSLSPRTEDANQAKDHTWTRESTRNGLICTASTHKRSTIKADTRMPHWQSVCPKYDPMAQVYLPMIGRIDGRD
ncbi:reverse transcriptase domain-containing protein [Tanacetum coccineum]|uniref:Reverse transcriptase domain-containing protein n=1 Tax=Tanacetum coccineum TaxID=301880 RepID=A0ABQ5CCQ2_9ASTR